MSDLELEAVASVLRVRLFKADEVICRNGEIGREMFIVKSGQVASMALDSEGNERVLYVFGKGRFFGEMSIIESEPRSATCIAVEETELYVLEGIQFYNLVWGFPMLGLQILTAMGNVMSGWLDEASGFLTDLLRWGETARKRAISDSLTGLFNRNFLEETVRKNFSFPGISTILMLDIDHFHKINDQFGNDGGDQIIAQLGKSFPSVLREGDIAARLAGDEFAFYLPGTGAQEAWIVAERIRHVSESMRLRLTNLTTHKEEKISITVSIGLAVNPVNGTEMEAVFQAADKALFKAKELGRNRVFSFF
jgi:diguanylate cyclase (GGDEF)-like protein